MAAGWGWGSDPAGAGRHLRRLLPVGHRPGGAVGTVAVTSDCRELFPPLTALEQLLYVSGDGQEGAPGAPPPQPLELRVTRGTRPVAGASVRFAVQSGGGLVGDGSAAAASQYETTTDESGVASCRWTLGPGATAPARYQRVRASLLDGDGNAIPGQILVYCATATAVTASPGGGCAVTIGQGASSNVSTASCSRPCWSATRVGSVSVCCPAPTRLTPGGRRRGQGPPLPAWLGPTALLRVQGGLTLSGLAALELRDVALELMGSDGPTGWRRRAAAGTTSKSPGVGPWRRRGGTAC